jgi:hypothetical protein
MRFARVVGLVVTAASLSAAVSAHADQTVAPTPVGPPAIVALSAPWPTILRRIAAGGDRAELVQTVFEALADLRRAGIGEECCDPARNYFLVSFVGADPDGAPQLITVLAHAPMPASTTLPGIHGTRQPLFEIFLSDDLTSSLQTTYAITREENPAQKQTGAFAAAIIANLALPLALAAPAPAAHIQEQRPKTTFQVAVAFRRVVLPEAGAIEVRQVVTLESPVAHMLGRVAAVHRDRPPSPDADETMACSDFSAAVNEAIDAVASGTACGLWPADLAACSKNLRAASDRTASAYFAAPSPGCRLDAGAPVVQEYLAAIQDVKPISATIAIGNAPLIRYGFGLAAAYVARVDEDANHPRVRLQGNRIVADPFARQLTMGVVNLTPWGYDSQRPSPSLAERARLVAGVAFSPSFGVTMGGAFAINRYLAVNAGYARLWFDAPKPGEQIGAAPSPENAAQPFALRSTGALFFGVSYTFK